MTPELDAARSRLEESGFIHWDGARWRTTRRWQGALSRASLRLIRDGEAREDLRIAVAAALIEGLGADLPDEELAALITAILVVQAAGERRRY
jgi:hypothetical protein